MRLATAEQMRTCDRITIDDLGIPGVALMESAGRGAAASLMRMLDDHGLRANPNAEVGVFCGGGNNGGDGYVIARELLRQGVRARVILLSPRERIQGDARVYLDALERMIDAGDLFQAEGVVEPWGDRMGATASIERLLASLPACDAWVDAMLGTGLSQPVRSPYSDVIAHLNASAAPVLAVDLPSGLSADTGQPLGCAVQATRTATFALAKVGMLAHPGHDLCGALDVIDIGIAPGVYDRAGVNSEALTRDSARALLPSRPRDGHKGTFGHVLAVGGAEGMSGAIALCAHAALRAGAGLVTAATSGASQRAIAALYPEVMTDALLDAEDVLGEFKASLGRKAALAVGPGLGQGDAARMIVRALLTDPVRPMVLDADALNLIAQDDPGLEMLTQATDRVPVVLTPHPGELARLIQRSVQEVQADALGIARELAVRTGCIVVCKGAATCIAHPDGRLALNTSGNAGMATGGSGDVLTGIIAALIAQRMIPWSAARLGVYLHGVAGDVASARLGPHTVLAGDLTRHLGDAFQTLAPA